MLARARRRVDHRGRDFHRPRQRDDDAMNTDSLRRAKQRPEVLRVLQGIENQHKRRFVFLAGVVEDVNHIHVGITAHIRDHALMVLVDFVQPSARAHGRL